MEKIDKNLVDAIAEAEGLEHSYPVLIICQENCDAVVDKLKALDVAQFNIIDELNMISASVTAEVISEIEALDTVEKIELDAEARIN